MSFLDSLRLAIAFGLTLFLVILRFDSERITRSDYFRYRTPWMGPVSYYVLVIGFAIGIAIILPNGRERLFLTGGETDEMLPIMLLFVVIAILNAVALAFLRYGGITSGECQGDLIGTADVEGGEFEFREQDTTPLPTTVCVTASPGGAVDASAVEID